MGMKNDPLLLVVSRAVAFDVAVSGDSNVKGAVLGCVLGVLEPHGTHEVKLFSGSDP